VTRSRDRLIAFGVALLVVVLGSLIMFSVLDAQSNGRDALERLQTQQVRQLANGLGTRVSQITDSFLATLPVTFEANSEADSATLTRSLSAFGGSTGAYLVDLDGRVTTGYRLRDASYVGSRYTDPAFAAGLKDGKPHGSTVHRGRTIPGPVADLVVPVRPGGQGEVAGFLVYETEVTPDSGFNEEIRTLQSGKSGVFSYIDQNDVVLASSDSSTLGRRIGSEAALPDLSRGFHRGHGKIAVVAPVPAFEWRAVFFQDANEFEGGLTGSVRSALLFLTLATLLVAGVLTVVLLNRLRTARAEQRRLADIAQSQEEFIGIVSHELRTPVSGLLGFLQTTIDHWDAMPDGDRRRAVTRAFANARRLQSLTSDVLDASRIEAGDFPYSFESVDLREEVTVAVEAAQDGRPGTAIHFTPPDDAVLVRADPDRIQQVLTNVLDNALRHSPPGAPVDVTLRTVDGEAIVAVCDHGPGILPEDAERIFQKFVRGRTPTAGGTGLGLYISRRIVDAHGGRIWAAGRDGHGAELSVALPRAGVAATGSTPSA
jgi:signal transduction histidine kinase